jgi:Tfp pilus assembly PilM family ATPase
VFNNHIGINLTETKLQLVEISFKDDSFYLENVDQTIHTENLTTTCAEDKLISILQSSFNKIAKRKPLNSQSVSFALPNNYFKIFEVPYDDSLVKKDLHEHFRWEISILFPECDKDNYFIQHIEIDKSAIRCEKKAIIFAVAKNLVTAINKFCRLNTLDLKYIDNAHLASNAFLYLDKQQVNNEITLSIYVDRKFSSISAMDGIFPFYFKVLDPSAQNIFDEITAAVNKLNDFNLSLNNFNRVLLYGQDLTDEFENKMKNFFGSSLKIVNPFEHLRTEESILKNPLYRIKFNSFTAATGIAIRIV